MTAEEILKQNLSEGAENDRLCSDLMAKTKLSLGAAMIDNLKLKSFLIAAMKQYAEQERRKAFEAAKASVKRGIAQVEVYRNYTDYSTKNPLE